MVTSSQPHSHGGREDPGDEVDLKPARSVRI